MPNANDSRVPIMIMLKRILKIRRRLIPIGRVLRRSFIQHFNQTVCYRRVLLANIVVKFHIIRRFSHQQGTQRDAQRIHICARIRLHLSIKLFRRRIPARTHIGGIAHILRLVFLCYSKIQQFDLLSVRQQLHIGRLHISVNDFWGPGMQILQYIAKLRAPKHHIFRSGRTVLHFFCQGFAFYKILNNVDRIVLIHNVHNAHNIGVIQLGEHFCF